MRMRTVAVHVFPFENGQASETARSIFPRVFMVDSLWIRLSGILILRKSSPGRHRFPLDQEGIAA